MPDLTSRILFMDLPCERFCVYFRRSLVGIELLDWATTAFLEAPQLVEFACRTPVAQTRLVAKVPAHAQNAYLDQSVDL
jgi:hypothetical protein